MSLIHVAKQMQHRQFIFITPQDVSSLKADPMLKIWKLSPPERHDALVGGPSQQTLDFSQKNEADPTVTLPRQKNAQKNRKKN